jgi:hypothetical protein
MNYFLIILASILILMGIGIYKMKRRTDGLPDDPNYVEPIMEEKDITDENE